MPIYEYQCEKCGGIKEVFQRMSDGPLTECDCGGHLKKLISMNSFHLKGSGWYVTDYGKGNTSQTASTGKSQSTEKTESSSKPDKPEKKAASEKSGTAKSSD